MSCALITGLLACDPGKKHRTIDAPDAGTALLDLPDAAQLQRCAVNAPYLAQHKACSVDADCTLFEYRVNCCPDAEHASVGIRKADLEQVQACEDSAQPVCLCSDGLTRAEDGRVVNDSSPAQASCVAQRCVSAVGARTCGSRATCSAREICVTYQNIAGGIPPDPDTPDNKLLTFRCVPNPCQGQLDCECVQPICDARNDAVRKCEIKRNEESDVTCIAYQD